MTTNYFISLLLATACLTEVALASGNIIGNGAGLVENQFQFAYSTLNSVATQCSESHRCELTSDETKILQKIHAITIKNHSNPERLLFLSENRNPGFFQTGDNENHRIAKTTLDPHSAIYVNLDLIYSSDGKPVLDYPTIVSILTHEVGHQAGELNHAKLDILGNKLKKVVSQRLSRHRFDFSAKQGEATEVIEILLISHEYPVRNSEFIISWDLESRNVTSDLVSQLTCQNSSQSVAGFEFQNGHYILNQKNQSAEDAINFGLWIDVYCYSSATNTVEVEKYDMKLEIKKDMSLKTILLQILNPN